MDYQHLKSNVMALTGLEKDALHIYVGMGVFVLAVCLLRPVLTSYRPRALIAVILVTAAAVLGEYLDNRQIITAFGVSAIGDQQVDASIHDLINTCFWPYVLYAVTAWTRLFNPSNAPTQTY